MTRRFAVVFATICAIGLPSVSFSAALLDKLGAASSGAGDQLIMNPMTPQDVAMLAMQRGEPVPGQPVPGQAVQAHAAPVAQQVAMQMPQRPSPPEFSQPRVLAQAKRPAAEPAPKPQPQPQGPPGIASWLVECPPQSAEGCQMIRRAVSANGQQLLAVVISHDAQQQGRLTGTVVLPLGVQVRESVPMLIDGRFIALMPIQTCLPAGCIMNLALSPALADVLRKGGVLDFLALSTNGQTVKLSLPLGGFGEAFAKVAG